MQLLLVLCLLAQAKAGDKMTVTAESDLDLDIEVRDGTGESKRVLNVIRKDKFEQVVIEAADGKVRSAKIKCLSSMEQKSGTDTPISADKPTTLHGLSFTVMRAPSGWSVKDQDGSTPTAEGQSLGAWNDAARFLPAEGEPKAGATWDMEARDVMAILAPTAIRDGQGKLTCRCEAAEGGKVSISFTGSIKGKARDESVVSLDLNIIKGQLVYDLSKGRPVSLSLSGSIQTVYDMVDVFRRPNDEQEERRKVGEIVVRSKRMEATFTFSD